MESAKDFAKTALIYEDVEIATLNRLIRMVNERDAAIRKECADMAVEKFWYELHEEAENQYDRRVELLGPVETAEDASYRKTLYDGWSAWMLAKRIVINRHATIEGKKE